MEETYSKKSCVSVGANLTTSGQQVVWANVFLGNLTSEGE